MCRLHMSPRLCSSCVPGPAGPGHELDAFLAQLVCLVHYLLPWPLASNTTCHSPEHAGVGLRLFAGKGVQVHWWLMHLGCAPWQPAFKAAQQLGTCMKRRCPDEG